MKHLSFLAEHYHSIKQTQDIVHWAKYCRDSYFGTEYMYVSLGHHKRYVRIGHGFSKGSMTESIPIPKEKKIAVIVCRPGLVSEAFNELYSFTDVRTAKHDPKKWINIFSSPLLEVWEHLYEYQTQPLRFGVSFQEKKLLLYFARVSLESVLKQGKSFQEIVNNFQREGYALGRFFQNSDVDVAFWSNGELRGSRIVEGYSCLEAIYNAVSLASEDVRFRPIAAEEASCTRIELTLFSDLRISLSKTELEKNEIYHEKGYCMKSNDEKGWFVPAVFNCNSFANLDHFLQSLFTEKINKNKKTSKVNTKKISVFEVFGCIETLDKENVLSLYGPVLDMKENVQEKIYTFSVYEDYVRNALGFLVQIQESDGSYPGVISPFNSKRNTMDWARSSLVVWSIALSLQIFPLLKQEPLYEKCLLDGYAFLKKYLYTHKTMSIYVRCMSLIYYHKAAVALGDISEAKESHKMIMHLVESLEYEPIVYTQIGIHIFEYLDSTGHEKEKACTFARRVLEDFQEKQNRYEPVSTASYADVCNIVRLMGKFLHDESLLAKSNEIIEWYKKQQNKDGSFPSSVGSYYAYTRGTSKILEALSKENSLYGDKEFSQTITWMHSLQYNKEGMYFVVESLQKLLIGGFRHDYHNALAWIDSSAHYILALCYKVLPKN